MLKRDGDYGSGVNQHVTPRAAKLCTLSSGGGARGESEVGQRVKIRSPSSQLGRSDSSVESPRPTRLKTSVGRILLLAGPAEPAIFFQPARPSRNNTLIGAAGGRKKGEEGQRRGRGEKG